MERFASAYARALFPSRYGSRGGAQGHPGSAGNQQPMALAQGALEISMSAGIYAIVLGVERLLKSLRQIPARWRLRLQPGPGTTPIGCG